MFVCEICGKVFVLMKALKDHYRYHDKQEMSCQICNAIMEKMGMMDLTQSPLPLPQNGLCPPIFFKSSLNVYHIFVLFCNTSIQ